MSRGPGRWQRTILDALESGGGQPVALTRPEDSHAEQNAIRRAANALEAAGKITVTSLRVGARARLVAYPPQSEAPETLLTTGLDGKTYRRPQIH